MSINRLTDEEVVEYYSATKSDKIGSFVEMWMDLESVTQSEISQKEKNIQRAKRNIQIEKNSNIMY